MSMTTTTTKPCSTCQRTLPLSNFHKAARHTKSGHQYFCKVCAYAANAVRSKAYSLRSDSEIPFPEEKKCSHCQQTLSADHFAFARGRRDGLQRFCRSCNHEYLAEWRAKKRLLAT